MKIIDTHAHYDDETFDKDRGELLGGGLQEAGVEYVVNMGASMEGAEESVRLAEKYPMVYAGVGIHPDDVGIFRDSGAAGDAFSGSGEGPGGMNIMEGAETALTLLSGREYKENPALERLRVLLSHPKAVCVGEIGLDYHWMVQPKEIQKKWFAAQLRLAAEVNLPVNIHSRDAAQDTFDTIVRYHTSGGRTKTGGIIHCYSGSVEMARDYVRLGYHIGVGGVVTFRNAKILKSVVREIPLESIVTETDSPYMAPEPVRGTRNDSRNIRYVIQKIAEIKDMDPETCAKILRKNALDVYTRLPDQAESCLC